MMSPAGHGPRLLESVYKCFLYPFPDAMSRFWQAAGVYNIGAKTRDSVVLLMLQFLVYRSLIVRYQATLDCTAMIMGQPKSVR